MGLKYDAQWKPLNVITLGQAETDDNNHIQWKPLNVITDNVIIQLM